MNEKIKPLVEELNAELTKKIKEKTKGKRVLLNLSGGHDTRVNLSILLKNNISFTAYTHKKCKGDIKIAKKIAKKYKFKHIINNESVNSEKRKKKMKEIRESYDIVLSGHAFTETLCALHELNRSFNTIIKLVEEKENKGNNYSPILEESALEIVKRIPVLYLAGSTIQKELIRINKKDLLKVEFTYYDWRQYLLNHFHQPLAGFIFNSYYRGKGRELVDTKKQKDRWWEE